MSNTDITHSFSRDLAEHYGVNAAIVLGYLGYKIQHSQHTHDKKRWYFDTLDALAEQYPYLSRTAIYQATKRLTQNTGPLITGNFNKKGYDRTTWYAFNADPAYEYLADNIVGTAEALIQQTDPAQLYRLQWLPDQGDLNFQLSIWYKAFFEQVYDTKMSKPELPENEQYRQMFLEHGLCFLNMGFHFRRFSSSSVYPSPHSHRICMAIINRVEPWKEQQTALLQAKTLQERSITYASPDKDKEASADLSAGEKMQVFNQNLQARNRIGQYDEYGRHNQQVVLITKNTLNLAREFFQLNPHFTVADLNKILDACLKLPKQESEKESDPLWHARNGHKISLLLTSLATIASQLNMLSELPAFTPLPVKEEPAK